MQFTVLRVFKFDSKDANFASAFIDLAAAFIAVGALISNDYLLVDGDFMNGTYAIGEDVYYFGTENRLRMDACKSIGIRDFWNNGKFGGFFDDKRKPHVAYHYDGKILIDCMNPRVANLFYVLTAVTFVVVLVSCAASVMHVLSQASPFVAWMRRNTLLEMSNMVLTLIACISALLAQAEVTAMRPGDEVSIGPGLFLVSIAGLLSFTSAAVAIRHWARLQRARRVDNQRLMCPRSLRSWRDANRTDDQNAIADYEGYLDSDTKYSKLDETGVRPEEII